MWKCLKRELMRYMLIIIGQIYRKQWKENNSDVKFVLWLVMLTFVIIWVHWWCHTADSWNGIGWAVERLKPIFRWLHVFNLGVLLGTFLFFLAWSASGSSLPVWKWTAHNINFDLSDCICIDCDTYTGAYSFTVQLSTTGTVVRLSYTCGNSYIQSTLVPYSGQQGWCK
jgi:hypothetical protein